MKVLIDEQLPVKLKYRFVETGYNIHTVRDLNWLGTKNGNLLQLMIANGFDVLLTNDKNLYYQQKISALKLCVVNINTKTNRYDDVLATLPAIKNKLKDVEAYLQHSNGGYFII